MSGGIDIKYLIRALIKYNASDLHLKSDRPPLYRINGKLIPAKMPEMTEELMSQILLSILTDRQKIDLERERQIDMSFSVKGFGRFRCNIYYQRGALSAVIRMIPMTVPRIDDLAIPEVVRELAMRPRGLFLVTGPTGSGKTTTLAAIVQYINETRYSHILTLEDPIEFVHHDLKSSITQREVGSDVRSLEEALYAGLRQDPDVIVIGEMRDTKMIQLALTAAETGHLVLSTLHTNDAKSTIDRILDVFGPDEQNQIRVQLASTLVGVCSQQLIPRADGSGRVVACEIMVKSPAIEQYIAKNELDQIPEAIQNSSGYYKMQTLNKALHQLIKDEVISVEEALKVSQKPDDLKLSLAGLTRQQGYDISGLQRKTG